MGAPSLSRRGFLLGLVLSLALATPPADAAKAPRVCLRQCRQAKSQCQRAAKDTFASAKAACGDAACLGAAKAALRGEKKACATALKAECAPCCKGGGIACARLCGDGLVNEDAGEACDPPGPACDARCQLQPLADVTTTFEATLTPGTTVIDAGTLAAELIELGDAQARFRPSADQVRGLPPGAVVIFAGRAVRRVVSVTETADEIVVATAPAVLSDAIQQGTLGWTHDLSWSAVAPALAPTVSTLAGRSVVLPPGSFLMPQASPLGALSFEGKIQGFDAKVQLVPGTDRLDLAITATRSAFGKKALGVKATGFISTFRHEGVVVFDASTATLVSVRTIGGRGEMNVTWAALGVGDPSLDSAVSLLNMPLEIPIPFAIGPIPFVLKLKAVLQVVPELSISKASSGGAFKVTFDSDQGISLDTTGATGTGGLKASAPTLTGDTGSAGFGPVGYAIGVEFPRFELSMLGVTSVFVTVKSYFASLFTPGTTLTNDIPPCQTAYTDLFSAVGWKVGILGSTALSVEGSKEIWRMPRNQVYKDGIPCTLTGQ
jgi:hypothetical protein